MSELNHDSLLYSLISILVKNNIVNKDELYQVRDQILHHLIEYNQLIRKPFVNDEEEEKLLISTEEILQKIAQMTYMPPPSKDEKELTQKIRSALLRPPNE